jgi:protein-tyrosine-phosphatase
LPIIIGSVRYPGIKIHETRIIRLLEILLHAGTEIGGWTAKQIHQTLLTTFHLSANAYSLNQLRYDLRKLKGHSLLQRDGSRYSYRLTRKGIQVALLFLFFHKRLCGPLANSRFHHKPDPTHSPNSKLEAAYHKADKAIEQIVDLLKAA